MAVLAAMLVAPTAAQAVRYASPTGSAIATCSDSTTNGCTLEAAVEGNAAGVPSAGEEVIVLPGSYTQTSELTLPSINLNVHGQAGQPAPVINASGIGRTSVNNGTISYLRFESSTISETINLNVGKADRIFIRSSSNGSTPACQCYGFSLSNSVIVATGTAPALGIRSNGGSATMIYRNVTAYSANAAAAAILVQQLAMSGTIALTAINTIALNGASGTDVVSDGPGATITFDHSNYRTTATPDAGVIQDAPGGPHQTALPLFANPGAGDFGQLAGSPTIDAGITDPLNGTMDFAGNPRTIGSTTDIGALEMQPPAPPATQPPGTTTNQKCKKKPNQKSAAQAKKKRKKGCKKKRKKKR